MDFYWNVLLVSILLLGSLVNSAEFPVNHIETSSEHPSSYTLSDLLSAVGQRGRRQAKTDTNKNYEPEYDYNDSKLGTSKEDPPMASQRNCQCPPSQQPPMRRGSSGRSRYEYNGPRRGTGHFGYRRENGYIPRRMGYNWWFDERDDYADDILVYRFYNGRSRPSVEEIGNLPRRTGYQVQQRGLYQLGITDGGRISEDRGSTYQRRRPVGSDNYKSNTSTLESQGWIPIRNTTRSRISGDPGIYSEHDSEGELTEYKSGVNSESSRKTEESSLFTTTPRLSTSSRHDIDDCCYQRENEERKRVGDMGKGTDVRIHSSTTTTTKKPVKFFGITWSRLSDYGDFRDEIDSDIRSINFDKEKDRKDTVR